MFEFLSASPTSLREINQVLSPLPQMEEVLSSFANASIFTIMVLVAG